LELSERRPINAQSSASPGVNPHRARWQITQESMQRW
jgi:hypothetical protein